MKKSLFIIAATALIISCSNNDVKNDIVEAPIGFTKVYIEKGVKSAINSVSDMETAGNTFGVFGYKTASSTTTKVFGERTGETAGVEVTFGTDWTYSPLRYWDKVATEYNFYAYAPHSNNFTGAAALASNSSNAFSISGFQQNNSHDNMVDLMVDLTSKQSVTTGIGTNDVEFTFSHILSNINIKMAVSADLKKDETANPVTVVSVAINDIKLDGSYSYNDGYKWTIANNSSNADFAATQTSNVVFASGALKAASNDLTGGGNLINPADYSNGTSDEQYIADLDAAVGLTDVPGLTDLLFIPQGDVDDYTISVQYKIKDEVFDKTINLGDFTKKVNNVDTPLETWVPGYKYTYVLVIGPTPILFDVNNITDWTDGGTYTYVAD